MKKILINRESWQTRVAILENNKLQDLYFESHARVELERSFFKGRVAKVLPGIQTAFVDFGQSKAGFLHITEVDRALAVEKTAEAKQVDDVKDIEEISRTIKHEMNISNIFKEGDDVLIQVIKEPISLKGAKLTTCFTLPGKFVVLMPNIPQIGVSKKIEDRDERLRLKEIISSALPKGMGAIIRTTAEGLNASALSKDLAFLVSVWRSILKKFSRANVGDTIHEDLFIGLRAIRDHLGEEIEMVICDTKDDLNAAYKFVKHFMPDQVHKIRLYDGQASLFDYFNVEKQIEEALQKKVELKSGSTLIIESTEAMTVIDVNTGRFTGRGDSLEETILKTNLEAAEEVVRQLRLRNIGGLIVIDFIDMWNPQNRQKLSRVLEKALKEKDKFQSVALKVSEFGLVQMTRKRSGKALVQQLTQECAACNSYGFVKSPATISYEVLRDFKQEILREKTSGSIVFTVSNKVFDYLVHYEFQSILGLEKQLNCKIIMENNEDFEDGQFSLEPFLQS